MPGLFDAATSCRCKACSDDPLPKYGEAHRHACEVRYVVGLADNDARAGYLARVLKARGKRASDRLRRDAWEAMRCKP